MLACNSSDSGSSRVVSFEGEGLGAKSAAYDSTRLLSSPPFSRFFKIGAITKKVLEISYESYGSEFPNSFYKKSRCDPRPRFFE